MCCSVEGEEVPPPPLAPTVHALNTLIDLHLRLAFRRSPYTFKLVQESTSYVRTMKVVLHKRTIGPLRALEKSPRRVAIRSLGTLRPGRSGADGGLGTVIPRLARQADSTSSPAIETDLARLGRGLGIVAEVSRGAGGAVSRRLSATRAMCCVGSCAVWVGESRDRGGDGRAMGGRTSGA